MLSDFIDAIACAAHMANRAYCIGMGDYSQPRWEEAPEWQKESARNGVRLAAMYPGSHTPEKSHESWLSQKQAEGWTYGPVKDPEKKQHPCMVPYAQLPENQRLKDDLFLSTVYAMITELRELGIPVA